MIQHNFKMLRYLFVICLLFTSGCVDLVVETRFKPNGSGVQIWRFTSSALISSQIKKFVDSHTFLKHGKRLLDEYRKGEYLLGLEFPFENATELQDGNREISFIKQGTFKQTCIYTETWKPELGGSAGPLAEKAGSLLPIQLRWEVVMPGKIEESNAHEIRGNVAVWNLTLTSFSAEHSFTAKSTYWNTALIAGLSAGAFALFGVVLLVSRKVAASKKMPCAACGTILATSSAFCSKCGKPVSE